MKYLLLIAVLLLSSCVATTADLTRLRDDIRTISASTLTSQQKLAAVDASIGDLVTDIEAGAWSMADVALAIGGLVTGTGVLSVGATGAIRDRKRKLRGEPTTIPLPPVASA